MIKIGIIRKLLGKVDTSGSVSHVQQQTGESNQQGGISQRLQNIYGQEKIELQMLYENWVVKDTWLLKHEAIPLLFGIDPGNIRLLPLSPELQNNIDQLWLHAKNCVEQGLLKVINQEQVDEDWCVRPVDIYRWARISRIELPDIFNMLIEFVSKTIKQPELQQIPQGDSNIDGYIKFDENREKVLGITLALLAAYPEKCRNSRGRVNIDKIISLINEKGEFWLGNEPLDLSTTAIRDLISKWLNTLPVSNDANE